MRAIINGSPNAPVAWAKGSNNSALVLLMNDNGSVLDITGGSVDLVVYDRSDRANAAIATHAGDTLTTPTAGFATVAVDDSELTYGPGEYYVFARHTTSGSLVYYSAPYVLQIK
jgi:hypothetical protein